MPNVRRQRGRKVRLQVPTKRPKPVQDPFPAQIEPQLATLVSVPPSRGEWTYEIKLDGYRILARLENGAVRLFTRNRNPLEMKRALRLRHAHGRRQ